VPGVSSVTVAESPGAMRPVSKLPVAVAVWASEPVLVNVTVSPTCSVSVGGEKPQVLMSLLDPCTIWTV
jgi:hypothetical protein